MAEDNDKNLSLILNEKIFSTMLDERINEDVKINRINFLLNVGGDVNARDFMERNLVFYATMKGHVKLLDMLLEKNGDSDAEDKNGNGVLIYSKNKEMYDFWVKKGKVFEESIGEYPLCAASDAGSSFMVEKLIEYGQNVDEKDYLVYTPLMYGASKGYEDVVKILLENGANIEAGDEFGKTPLMYAVLGKHFKVVEMLLDKGAEVDGADFEGWTALTYGACCGITESVDILVKKGADVNHKIDIGECPLSLALDNIEMIKKLFEHKADANIKDFDGETPFSKLVSNKGYSQEAVKLFIKNGADLNVRDKNGKTPLMKVLKNPDYKFDVVKMLVENGAKIAVEDKWGGRPILLAIEEKRKDAEIYLKKKQGPNPKIEVFYSFEQNR